MSVQAEIERKLTETFGPTTLVVENESDQHKGPKGRETHFKALIVSANFEGMNAVARQRAVYSVLREELAGGVHALSLRTLTPAQFDAGEAEGFVSPRCM